VAGPIVRAARLLPQIAAPRRATRDEVGWGLALTVIGLFCKTVLADSVFAPIVDEVYSNPGGRGALDIWTAVLGFSSQIYYDFGGYSLCAIGLALCFGIEFPDNFRFPYAACGFSDFWRRWHISLSSWLRDYLYVSLGGNRLGTIRTYANLMLTMLIGGLWHGASWMFVLWGGLHGFYLAVERWWRGRKPDGATHEGNLVLPVLLTFLIVTLTWIPFRCASPAMAWAVLAGLFSVSRESYLSIEQITFCFLLTGIALYWQFTSRGSSLEARFSRFGSVTQIAILAGCLIAMFLCSGGDERAFIYFQF
jgi:alginate O-acetyltransferase complex protein AlgI